MPIQGPMPSVPLHSRNTSTFFSLASGVASAPQLNGIAAANMLEGWRAVLAVVCRNGLGRRQRQRSDRSLSLRRTVTDGVPDNSSISRDKQNHGNHRDSNEEPMELDGIEAMVEGVKASGVSASSL